MKEGENGTARLLSSLLSKCIIWLLIYEKLNPLGGSRTSRLKSACYYNSHPPPSGQDQSRRNSQQSICLLTPKIA
jgi:hypothetical protein